MRVAAGLLAAAAAYAAAEILLGVFVGDFSGWGRAEALLFFALRPWLLLIGAVLIKRHGWRTRYSFYAAALLLAALSESLFLIGLGATSPWAEAARGIAAGAVVALVFDLALAAGVWLGGRAGRWTAAALLLVLLALPAAHRPYEAIAIGSGGLVGGEKQDLMLVSALPLVWGEPGPLDPGSRPAAAYRALAEEFTIRPLDVLDEANLARGRLLLVAQPRALAPEELVALDQWVRDGGRAVILTDPRLLWPSELPLGDIRRAPGIGLLDPLLTHWGLRLEPPEKARAVKQDLDLGAGRRRLILFAPGRFVPTGSDCTVGPTVEFALCRIGRGRAILLADADMMHDRLWVGPGSRGTERHARVSDNVLILADWLDQLGGVRRSRASGLVQWQDEDADRRLAWLLALLPILAAAAPAASLRLRRRS
ncbi:MAG TPA: DUF4350 domain-containing protein [Allosphingosinicella sp.]